MAIVTNLPTDKLSSWYFAVRWSTYHIEQAVARQEAHGLDSTYDRLQLEMLADLEQFLKMSWDVIMDDLCGKAGETVKEVSRGNS